MPNFKPAMLRLTSRSVGLIALMCWLAKFVRALTADFSSVRRSAWIGHSRRKLVALMSGSLLCHSHALMAECKPTFEDDFEGNTLAPHWQIVEGDGCGIGLCGWGNKELQTYHRRSITVADGSLQITASPKDAGYFSGKLTTEDQFAQRFGRFEARIKLPAARGMWPAFWLMPQDPAESWPIEGEIDIMEWGGNKPNTVIGAAHFGKHWPENVHYSETLLMPTAWHEEFHVFALNWELGKISWEVDGRAHGSVTPRTISPWRWVFNDKPFYIILNMAVGGNIGGEVFAEDLPATMLIDWVRVYDYSCLPRP